MTMFEKIKAMDLDEMVLFICNVSEGILDEEYDLTTCSCKSFAEICKRLPYELRPFLRRLKDGILQEMCDVRILH